VQLASDTVELKVTCEKQICRLQCTSGASCSKRFFRLHHCFPFQLCTMQTHARISYRGPETTVDIMPF